MAKTKKPATPGAGKQTKVPRHFDFSRIFKNPRMLGWAVIWGLFFMIDAALLGLTSQQIHRHGGQNTFDWPGAEYGHVMGLLLFSSVFGLLISMFHWYFSVGTYMFLFLVLGVFNGVGGGVFQNTPFGRSLRCGNPVDTFPENYQPYVASDCSRVTAITGLAWALFGLSVIGIFYAFFDRFKLATRNTKTYDIETGPTEEEKAALARKTSEQSHHTSA